ADDLPKLGKTKVIRASHVEPMNLPLSPEKTYWCVRLAKNKANGKYAGKYLGRFFQDGGLNEIVVDCKRDARCFLTRADALAAEVEFITRNILEGHKHA